MTGGSEDRLAELVRAAAAAFPGQQAMSWLTKLINLDRVQVSAGVMQAARFVADVARTVGLQDVDLTIVAPGSRAWSFDVPEPWTPVRAELCLRDPRGDVVLRTALYPDTPCSVAVHSRAAHPGTATGPIVIHQPGQAVAADVHGAWVVVRAPSPLTPGLLADLARAGAVGVITDVPSRVNATGRVELPEGTGLIGFSLTQRALDQLLALNQEGAQVDGSVELANEEQVGLPIVSGRFGPTAHDTQGEVLVFAHLCHRAPGANDNGSGVVAALGIAASIRELASQASTVPFRRPIRFVWAPEFSGSAAWLYRRTVLAGEDPPAAVINLDMVGEDQQRCGGPLILEQTPSHIPSVLETVLEASLDRLPSAVSWSGAVRAPHWNWVTTPFTGASDHGLFSAAGVPAVQLGHWPDRFHHSSADTLDAVDPAELTRVGAAVAATAVFLATAGVVDAPWLTAAVARRAGHQLSRVLGEPVATQRWLLDQQLANALADLAVAAAVTGSAVESQQSWRTWLAGLRVVHEPVLVAMEEALAGSGLALPGLAPRLDPILAGRVFVPCWEGPFNLRGLRNASDREYQDWLDRRVSSSRPTYAVTLAVAISLDGRSEFAEVLRQASLTSGLPIPADLAQELVEALIAAGWLLDVTP